MVVVLWDRPAGPSVPRDHRQPHGHWAVQALTWAPGSLQQLLLTGLVRHQSREHRAKWHGGVREKSQKAFIFFPKLINHIQNK